MKSTLDFALIIVITLAVGSCSNRSVSTKKITSQNSTIDTISNQLLAEKGNPIDYNIKVITNVYVTVRDGIDSKSLADH